MKNSPVVTVLVMATCVLGFVVLGLAILFEMHYRQVRALQRPVQETQNTRNLINLLANDALEYSKTHPAIDPILVPAGIKPPKTGSAAASKTGSK
jgi:hypothetical protein